MEPTLDSIYWEHQKLHYPEMYKYVVMIAHENEDTGVESVGSGVNVRWGGRHLIATAAHCIRRNPRVMREDKFYEGRDGRFAASPPVRIIQRWTHPDLDIGFLEIGEALGEEMNEGQLFFGHIPNVPVHIIGYPVCRLQVDEQLKEKTLVKSVFATEVYEQTDSYVKLYYPVHGYRVEEDN